MLVRIIALAVPVPGEDFSLREFVLVSKGLKRQQRIRVGRRRYTLDARSRKPQCYDLFFAFSLSNASKLSHC